MQGKIKKATFKLGHLVSNEVVSSFQQDGVVFLSDVFGPWVEGVRQAIEQNKANQAGVSVLTGLKWVRKQSFFKIIVSGHISQGIGRL